MKLAHFALLAPLAMGLGLTGCGKSDPAAQQEASASEEISLSGGRLVLPAVSGNPGVAYFTLNNGTKKAASLAGVRIAGVTKAELHETEGGSMSPITVLNLGPGATVSFEPGGKHVMLFGISRSLKHGDPAKVTVSFAGGKEVVGELTVQAAGEADHPAGH